MCASAYLNIGVSLFSLGFSEGIVGGCGLGGVNSQHLIYASSMCTPRSSRIAHWIESSGRTLMCGCVCVFDLCSVSDIHRCNEWQDKEANRHIKPIRIQTHFKSQGLNEYLLILWSHDYHVTPLAPPTSLPTYRTSISLMTLVLVWSWPAQVWCRVVCRGSCLKLGARTRGMESSSLDTVLKAHWLKWEGEGGRDRGESQSSY